MRPTAEMRAMQCADSGAPPNVVLRETLWLIAAELAERQDETNRLLKIVAVDIAELVIKSRRPTDDADG